MTKQRKRLKIEVYELGDGGKPSLLKKFEASATRFGLAKREARVKLESEGFFVRSIILKADSEIVIVYVTKQRPDARERGKPVVHTGLVGKGREIRRRGSR